MDNQEKGVIPSIKIYLSADFKNKGVLIDACCGVEEESVPYETNPAGNSGDAVGLAYEAALNSILEVGIGIDGKGGLAVHFKKLKESAPLFHINYINEPEKVRSICSNAARLVKGTPFIID